MIRLLKLVYAALFTLTLVPALGQGSVLLRQKAEDAGNTFLQAAGVTLPHPCREAVFPAPRRYPNQPDIHFQQRWRLTWGDGIHTDAEMELVDAARPRVTFFYNFALSDKLRHKTMPGQAISEQQAVQDATKALHAAGQPLSELVFDRADLNQTTSPATSAGYRWLVSWKRQYKGVAYRHQQVNVILQAETGELWSLGVTFPSPPPVRFKAALTQKQAITKAANLLAQKSVSAPFDHAVQQVVQPNTILQTGGSLTPVGGVSRVAWACFFQKGQTVYEVWVDAENGQLLGGEQWSKPVPSPRSTSPLKTGPSGTQR